MEWRNLSADERKIMTNREFFVAVAATENIPAELREYAEAAVNKMNEKNEKRRNTPTKTELANVPLRAAVLEILNEHPTMKFMASEVAPLISGADDEPITTAKASSLLRGLLAEGKIHEVEVKVRGKGKRKAYCVELAEEVAANENEGE